MELDDYKVEYNASKSAVTLCLNSIADREVLKFSYSFNRTVDIEGQISGIPRGGKISLTVKARNDGKNDLLHWMLQPALPKGGQIKFKKRDDSDDNMKTIELVEAQCVEYTEDWEEKESSNVLNSASHTEKIVLSCRAIHNYAAIYSFAWE